MKTEFDPSKPLIEYLNYILMDEDNNQGYVTRDWTGKLVKDGIKRGEQTYKYVDIVWGEPYIKPITDTFNENDELLIMGKALGTDVR